MRSTTATRRVHDVYRRDPVSRRIWAPFSFRRKSGAPAAPASVERSTRAFCARLPAYWTVAAIERFGLAVPIDPLGSTPPGAAGARARVHGIESDLTRRAAALGDPCAEPLRTSCAGCEALLHSLGYEFEHVSDEDGQWLRTTIESRGIGAAERRRRGCRASHRVDAQAGSWGRHVSVKRFSSRSTLVPMLDE